MSIQERLEKIKWLYTPMLLIIVSSIFFALGRLSAIEDRHSPIKITNSNQLYGEVEPGQNSPEIGSTATELSVASDNPADGRVIGSKSGKKYYFPWCSTVSRIKPENQVAFASIALARAAGYLPGGNCKGLK